MTRTFSSALAHDIVEFLAFKRMLGHPYQRAEETLRRFDRVAAEHNVRNTALREAVTWWLRGFKQCQPVTVATELGVIRQFCLFRRRRDVNGFVPGREWAPQSTESKFLPHIFSTAEVRALLRLTGRMRGPTIFAATFRTLLLILYCTGLRFGEALRLRVQDVDIRQQVLFVASSKGRARWVPFGATLAAELRRYRFIRARCTQGTRADTFLIRASGAPWPVPQASVIVRRLFRRAGLKPKAGRVGPRPYDFRHTFAVHRLTRWYRQGVNLQERLAWLSAYMGHQNILGTEVYLHATPELLQLAAHRFGARARRGGART